MGSIAAAMNIGATDVRVHTLKLAPAPKSAQHQHAQIWMREILARLVGVPPSELQIVRASSGKPFLVGGEIRFNLSHSGEFALLAVSAVSEVGVDVQKLRPLRDQAWWRRRLCTERELRRLDDDAGGSADLALLRLWTRKEATLKATGDGLARELNEVDVWDESVDGGLRCVDLPPPAAGYLAAVAYSSAQQAGQSR